MMDSLSFGDMEVFVMKHAQKGLGLTLKVLLLKKEKQRREKEIQRENWS